MGCRNLYFGDESKFELYAASKALRPRVESAGGKSLNFPDLADRVADDLYKDRLTIASAVEKLPLGNRAELRRWKSAGAQMLAGGVDGDAEQVPDERLKALLRRVPSKG